MGLQVGNVKISACNDHRNYSDEEITFGDIIRAEELLERGNKIASSIRSKKTQETINARLVDPELDTAVRKLLE